MNPQREEPRDRGSREASRYLGAGELGTRPGSGNPPPRYGRAFSILVASLLLLSSSRGFPELLESAKVLDGDVPREAVAVTKKNAAIFIRGDVDGSGRIDLNDAVWIARLITGVDSYLPCADAADVTDDGFIDLWDFRLLMYYLSGEYSAPLLTGLCAEDLTPDSLQCAETTCQ